MTAAGFTVILAGSGPVCLECFSRGFVGDLPVKPDEVYTFSFACPESELTWNIGRARELLARRPRQPQTLDPRHLAKWLRDRVTITPEHLDHIPVNKHREPGIVVVITTATSPDAPPYAFAILIDGSHRAALALGAGRDFSAYLLTEEEQRSICTYRVEGQVAEIPLIPGPGITDADVGLA